MQILNNENIANKNVQDIFLRNASLALLDILNREIYIDLVRNNKIEKHTIPFFYNFGGDKGFMQDFFIDLPDGCSYPSIAEGNYDVIPRGIVTFQTFSVKSSDITNKFVRGTFTQEERGENDEKIMKAYSARLYPLPFDLTFDIKIKSDNLNKTFKIMEKIFDFYYKNRVVYFQYRGIRIPGQVKFPEGIQNDKKYNFVYNEDTYITTTFKVEMETYYPVFDDHSKFFKGNHIQQFNISEKVKGSNSTLKDGYIDVNAPNVE